MSRLFPASLGNLVSDLAQRPSYFSVTQTHWESLICQTCDAVTVELVPVVRAVAVVIVSSSVQLSYELLIIIIIKPVNAKIHFDNYKIDTFWLQWNAH